ncbi:probable apyrase 6 isoform X1 [Olea europaea var. sylvestris]|uniref:probable apyrase 6 isoform X1 n=1 Tax=Olea europaea var. sylvestris TaxID=158386 RepID=UPI000C1D40A7|nr:probable apyrase 6 isoform X1 [Olea europaea var. sylvestris]XP_022878310.1 probable apyrase 6 isoform X1 [Olea europaea var. sylvestris]
MRRSNARKVRPRLENQMDHIKLQYRSARPVFRNPNSKNAKHRSRILLYTSILLALVLFCYILIFWNRDEQRKRYGVVIDGGSTGTRIHVFKYEVRNGNSVLDFTEKGLKTMKVSPGLSAHIEEPERAGAAVAELVEFARRNVPKEYWGKTEIRLMATAGMRLLKEGDQERILAVCRKVLRGSGFRFLDNWATVISGSDEGLYAWVVANYALGTLGGDPAHTTGIIELGGASAQVIFVSDEPMPPEYSRKVKFGNFTYNLYSHSLLQYGQNVALELLRELLVSGSQEEATESEGRKLVDPCTSRGYTRDQETQKISPVSLIEKNRYPSTFHPYGNFSECRSASLKLLRKGKDRCSYQRCYIGSTFIPKLQGKFLATENFFYTSKFFELTPRGFLSKLMVAGQQFCEGDWTELKRKYHSLDEEELLRYCFSSAYIVALLHDSLGIALDDDSRIGYANQVQNIPLDWALGAFILHSAIDSDVQHSNWIMIVISGDSSTLLLLLGFSLVSIAAWIVFKWRKPKQKTIYDLEKGKYIVKRGSRYS